MCMATALQVIEFSTEVSTNSKGYEINELLHYMTHKYIALWALSVDRDLSLSSLVMT